jgi:hypothetical protein
MSKSTPQSLISSKRIRKKLPVIVPIGIGLNDEREECFAMLIADGIPIAIAFRTAGFTAKDKKASALALYRSQRLQDRVTAILRARASHPPMSLSEVTDMLKRVYAGALHSNEFTPAHNAAFSLARLYGLVVDRAQLDVVRRPSREPDAPAERALSSWIAELPPYTPGPKSPEVPVGQGPGLLIEGSTLGCDLDTTRVVSEGPGGIGNGAPTGPVTGTPTGGGRVSPIGSPSADEGTGYPGGEYPSAEDLFGPGGSS